MDCARSANRLHGNFGCQHDGIRLVGPVAGALASGDEGMGRMAEPEEIANAVVFLASAKASYITGICMSMDGALNPIVV